MTLIRQEASLTRIDDLSGEECRTRFLAIALARVAAWSGVLAITILSTVPGAWRPHTFLPGRSEHFLAYACTGLVFAIGYRDLRVRLAAWAGLAVASGGFEILQIWIPGRGPSVFDAAASVIGLTLGLVLGAGVERIFRFCEDRGRSREDRKPTQARILGDDGAPAKRMAVRSGRPAQDGQLPPARAPSPARASRPIEPTRIG